MDTMGNDMDTVPWKNFKTERIKRTSHRSAFIDRVYTGEV